LVLYFTRRITAKSSMRKSPWKNVSDQVLEPEADSNSQDTRSGRSGLPVDDSEGAKWREQELKDQERGMERYPHLIEITNCSSVTDPASFLRI